MYLYLDTAWPSELLVLGVILINKLLLKASSYLIVSTRQALLHNPLVTAYF